MTIIYSINNCTVNVTITHEINSGVMNMLGCSSIHHSVISLNMEECESQDTPDSPTAKHKNIYNHLNTTTVWLNDKKRDSEELLITAAEERKHQFVWDGDIHSTEVQTAEDKGAWPADDKGAWPADGKGAWPADDKGAWPADDKEAWPADDKEAWPADDKGAWPADGKEAWPADDKGAWPADDKGAWPADDSEPSQGSLDSSSTCTSFNTDSESHCSVCEDQTAWDDVLDSPSSGVLLRDAMLGAFPSAWKKQFSIRPFLPKTPTVPQYPPVSRADTLILSPSLLTSPSHGLNHPLIPEGQETLQTLFEDVWIPPESTILKSLKLKYRIEPTVKSVSSGGFLSMESEEENKGSEDKISAPEHQKKDRKSCSHRHTAKTRSVQTQATSSKKKCVNGFIMFCRMNRRVYIRSHPGTPSTTVTRELASLWKVMPKQEKRLYCLKAWRFSCQQNRNVRAVIAEKEMEAEPSPLHRLLAHRHQYSVMNQPLHFI